MSHRVARLEISLGSLRLLAVDTRRAPLVATVDDALRVVGDQLGGIATTPPELRRWWIGGRVAWCYRVTVEHPEAAEPIAAELWKRGFSVRIDRASSGVIWA